MGISQRLRIVSHAVVCFAAASLLSCGEPSDEDERVLDASQAICRTATLTASKSYNPVSYLDGTSSASPAFRFDVPASIPVTTGNAGNQKLQLALTVSGVLVKCTYQGGSPVLHPVSPSDVAAGLNYNFLNCSDGSIVGSDLDVSAFTIRVLNGDDTRGTTTAKLALAEIAPNCPNDCTAGSLDDGNPCTLDTCDGLGNPVHTPQPRLPCSDGDVCNGEEICSNAGVCESYDPLDTDDADDCTIDICDPVDGVQHYGCTELDGTVTTTVGEALDFLISGPDPLQSGVEPDDIDLVRAAAVQGDVFDETGAPMALANVSIVGHPELGETKTDANGHYVMLVNGGGTLVVNVAKQGYLPSQRQVQTRWQAYDSVSDIVLVPFDSASTTIDLLRSPPRPWRAEAWSPIVPGVVKRRSFSPREPTPRWSCPTGRRRR